MGLLTKNRFEDLANERSNFCISVYIPCERSGENKKSRLKLKNKIAETEIQLYQTGLKNKEVDHYVEPLKKLLDDSGFWRHLSDALIIFRNSNHFNYTTQPIDVEEFLMVSDRYYLLPLLSVFNNNDTFFILILSQNNNKLYEATQNEITEIISEDALPENIEDTVGKDVKQKSLQFRTGHSNSGYGLYHGKGDGKDDKEAEIEKYLRDVDKGINALIEGYNAPLIVASVDYLFAMFKEISNYKNIYSIPVSGNHDNEDILLVHEKACEILNPWFEEERQKNKEKYKANSDKTLFKIDELIKAANAGSVETLFIEKDKYVWGRMQPDLEKIQIHSKKHPLDFCLLDFAARLTFLKGGKVFREAHDELPEPESPANAILRF
jgi:hypothetical protein